MSDLVRVSGLSRRYHVGSLGGTRSRTVDALQDVSFSLHRGEVLGIVGESGSGKSTLARTLLGLEPPSAGTVCFDGVDLAGKSRSELRVFRSRAQIVFQDPHGALDPRMRIGASLAEALIRHRLGAPERAARVAGLLEMVGLDPGRHCDYPHQLSGGQRQRVVIARALAPEPELLVLDEPTSGLDVSVQARIINLLMELRARLGLTYLFVSHDLNLISYVSDRIGVMKDGRLIEIASTDEVLSRPRDPYTVGLFQSAPVYVDRREVTHRF
jgi:peptide/nickel transport system ATP-binding protein